MAAKAPLTAGDYAVLALLRIRPMYGYEMNQIFGEAGLGAVLPVEQPTLYTYLRKVEGKGLVEATEEREGRRPPRRRFHLTDEGKSTVDAWLHTPVERMREVRVDFLVKLYVLREIDSAAERPLVEQQIAVCSDYREGAVAKYAGAETDFARLVAASKISAVDATQAWLQAYLEELEDVA